VIETQPLTAKMVSALRSLAGLGGMVFDWDIDYEVGQGILQGQDRCLWTKKGLRTTCEVMRDGGYIVSQSKDPDPVYFELKQDSKKVAKGKENI